MRTVDDVARVLKRTQTSKQHAKRTAPIVFAGGCWEPFSRELLELPGAGSVREFPHDVFRNFWEPPFPRGSWLLGASNTVHNRQTNHTMHEALEAQWPCCPVATTTFASSAAAAFRMLGAIIYESGQCNLPVPDVEYGDLAYTQISAGRFHTVMLRSDGIVFVAGRNTEGQNQVSGARNTVQTSAGAYHTVLLTRCGTAVARGLNFHRQCNIPALEAGTRYTQISAGHYHTGLLRSDGAAIVCGRNECGQCDAPDLGSPGIVLPVRDEADPHTVYTQISAGERHTVFLRKDGIAIAFGNNEH